MNKALFKKLLEKAKLEKKEKNFDRALELSVKALAFAQKSVLYPEVGKALIEMGLLLKDKSIRENDLQYLDEAVHYFEEAISNQALRQREIVLLFIEIAELYFDKKDYNKAETFYLSALDNSINLPEETVRIHLFLNQLFLKKQDSENALKHLKAAENVIKNTNVSIELELECFQELSNYHVIRANYVEIAVYAQRVIDLARAAGNGFYEAKALNTAAIPHAVRGEYKEAFEYMKAALNKAEELNLRTTIASTLVNLGNVFSALYSFEEAIKTYNKVLTGYREELQDISIGITYYNLGCAHLGIDDYKKGEEILREGLVIGKQLEHKLLISRIYFELVKICLEREDLETAIIYSFEVEKIYAKDDNSPFLDIYMTNLSMLSFLRGEYEDAIKYGNKAIFYCIRQNSLKTLKRAYKTMANIYKALGDFENAFDYLEQYSETSEDFMLQMRERRTMDLEIQYSLKDKENEITLLKQEMEIDKLKLQYQTKIENQNKKLKMSNDELRQFTYAISHDLKEPLRMISSFSKLWYRKHEKIADETDKEYFKYISSGADRMTIMLQGLLDYATIGQNARTPESVDLNEMIADIRTVLYVRIEENEVVFDIEQMPIVQTHRILLFQLMQNLISNAIKFKKPDTSPMIKISAKEEENKYVIAIQDNGIGIPEKHLETIFKIFKRLHTKEAYEGTGIGLSLCEKIAHHLGGSIWLESEEGVGSIFYFSLPKK